MTRDTVRAVVLAALMVFSIFAGTVALSGSAGAAATNVTGTSAADVEIGQASTTQTAQFSTSIDGGDTTQTYTLDVSGIQSNGADVSIGGTSDVSLGGTNASDVSVGGVTDNTDSTDEILIDITDTNQNGTAHDFTMTVTLTQNTTAVSSTTSGGAVSYDLTSNGNTGTVSFDLVDTTAPTTVVNSASATSAAGTLTVDYDLQDGGSGIDTSATVTNLEVQDANGDTLTKDLGGDLSTGTGQTVTFDLANFPNGQAAEGSLTATLTADDNAGNGNSDSTSVSVSLPNRAANADGSGDFDTVDGEVYVFAGATVFQGESDIQLGGSLSNGVVKTAGNDEGIPLEVPDVPQNQATGRYTTDGASGSSGVTVQRPRVTTLDVENENDEDIAGGSVRQGDSSSGSGQLTVVGAWNYENAENLELTVENEGGLEVTGDAVQDAGGNTGVPETKNSDDVSGNEVTWDVDLSDLNTGTFTFELAGTDDLDFGEASQSTTITVTGDDDVSLDHLQTDVDNAVRDLDDELAVSLDAETRNELAMLAAAYGTDEPDELVRRAVHGLFRQAVETGDLDFHLRSGYDCTYDEFLAGMSYDEMAGGASSNG